MRLALQIRVSIGVAYVRCGHAKNSLGVEGASGMMNLSARNLPGILRLRSRTLRFATSPETMAFANVLNAPSQRISSGCTHQSPATGLHARSAAHCHRRPIKGLRVLATAETETRAPATSNGSTTKVIHIVSIARHVSCCHLTVESCCRMEYLQGLLPLTLW